ncbi:ATP-dependent RNA helicase HrpA [Pseudohongiella acticola]|jgi:ATP-dependent RNA helicase HrpA|uniref:ATP-dependent RNA helicase HrpA n=1 Tax=Pseudohongiella acticola TaxID=1524254 RepID=UPI0030ED1070
MNKDLRTRIKQCLSADQFSLQQALSRLNRRAAEGRVDAGYQQALATLQARIEKSMASVQSRLAKIPVINYPAELPVSEKRQDIADALERHQIVVVAGETGSGKTTQIPKICLELGYGVKGLIGHTQPRRLAARAVASRIAEELGETLGQGVGYQVRFSDNTTEHTFIKLMTDGILLAEIQQDRFLNKYEVLIIDEAHERSLNIDFLLGYLKRLSRQRPDLKIIITSATIDVEKFSRHFSDAPIISVSGRTYPVEILYQDPAELDGDDKDDEILLAGVMQALRRLESLERQRRQRPGDVLIFLSGEREIRDLAMALRKQDLRQTEILPLYARLTQNEQLRIFAPHQGRRIILSTNVAETSLTVPGIRYVIDSGLVRISRYSVQSKVQRLPIEPVSQASANQRAGRCGRVASGICIRLYSESDFLGRPQYTDPEIQRTNLSAVILQMLLLKLGDISQFPFVEAPDRRAINDGFKLLDELGAIDNERKLTETGRAMARLPVDPRLGRILLEAAQRHSLYELLIIVSALSVQDPRDTPADKRQAARQKHQQFANAESDFLSWVVLWEEVEKQRQALTQGQFRKYCKENFLSWLRLREWRETHRQLSLSCQTLGFKAPGRTENQDIDYESVHRAMLPGSLNQLGQKTQDGFYLGSRGRKFSLFPSSALYKKMPRWIVSAELIETSRLFATMAARIEPEWAVDAAPHLLRRDHFEAHWEKKRGEVIAYEKISLFGLTLIEKRAVSYGAIDPVLSRDIFIREGLVAEQLETGLAFYHANSDLLATVRRQEEKERRPDILVSDDQLAAFYDERLPKSINNVAALEHWYREAQQQSDPLRMQREDVVARDVDQGSEVAFPDSTAVHHNELSINYRFEPGSAEDGISIDVPAPLVSSLTQLDLDWAVPGLVQERAVALMKSLPKALRKQFVPVPDFASRALENTGQSKEGRPTQTLVELLTEQAWSMKRIRLAPDDWDPAALPLHLQPRVRVLDARQRVLAVEQDLSRLQQQFSGSAAAATRVSTHPLERSGITDWDFGDLPPMVETNEGIRLLRYPALRDEGDSVAIVLCESELRAGQVSQRGLARLLMLRTAQQKNMILKQLGRVQNTLGLKLITQDKAWLEHAVSAVYRLCFRLNERRILTQAGFEALLVEGRAELVEQAGRLCRLLTESYDLLFTIRRQLASLPASYTALSRDIEGQLSFLFPDDFPLSVADAWLWEYPRYLKALQQRLDKLPANLKRDRDSQAVIAELQAMYGQAHVQARSAEDRNLAEFLWWLQELRVSLFAQTLGTRGPVSEKRLRKLLAPPR